jgi:hypothetical protein
MNDPMLQGPASNSIKLKCTLGMMILEATAREAETDQAANQTEAKAVETRTGAGRETDTTTAIETAGREEDIMRKREHETENFAETAKGI